MRQRYKVDMPCTNVIGTRHFWKSRLVYAGCPESALSKARVKLGPDTLVEETDRVVIQPISEDAALQFLAQMRQAH